MQVWVLPTRRCHVPAAQVIKKLRHVYKFKKPAQMEIFWVRNGHVWRKRKYGSPDISRKGKQKRTNRGQRSGMCSGEMHIVADVTSSF
jgi:hypothetical protein